MRKKLALIIIIGITFHFMINSVFKIAYIGEIRELSEKYNIKEDLVLSIIKVESDFREEIVSHKGAVGLMQLMPSTARWILKKNGKSIKDYNLYKARDNIEVGMLYYSYLNKKFDGDIVKIMIAYNAGASRVYNDSWKSIKETRQYILKIKVARIFYKYRLLIIKCKNFFKNIINI